MANVKEYTHKFFIGPVRNEEQQFNTTGKPTGQGFGAARKGPQVTGKTNISEKPKK